jgi:hypothetical protein
VSVEIPGPRVLALTYAGPLLAEEADLFRSGDALLERPRGTDAAPEIVPLADVRRRLWDALAALPARTDAGRPYDDLRRFVEAARPDTIGAYLDDVLGSLRASLPVYKVRASAPAPRGPAKTVGERKAAQRRRDREAEEQTAEWALRRWYASLHDPDALVDDRPPVGERLKIGDVYDALLPGMQEAEETHEEEVAWKPHTTAADRREEWVEFAEAEGYPLTPKAPGPRTFYAVADRLLGAPKRLHGHRVYTIPHTLKETPRMDTSDALAEEILDRVARFAWAEQREAQLGYLDRKHGRANLATTGTHGGRVVELASRRG